MTSIYLRNGQMSTIPPIDFHTFKNSFAKEAFDDEGYLFSPSPHVQI
jgi:hypothetical protein